MNSAVDQIVSLLSRLDPGLTADFLLSASIPLAICSSGLVRTLNVFEYGSTFPRCVLPIFNVVSVWRGGVTLSGPVLLYSGVISIHGLVLGGSSWLRNRSNRFVEMRDSDNSALHESSFFTKVGYWLLMSGVMSYWNTIPYLYTLRADGLSPSGLIGLSLIAVGAVLQAVADYQKKKHKEENGAVSFCTDGLYSLCRHPNYLGEVLLQLGVFVSGYSLFPSIPRWLLVGAVPLLNATMMFFITSGKAGEQARRYASNPEYANYQRNVKKLIPFIW